MEILGRAMLEPKIDCLHTQGANRPSYTRFPTAQIFFELNAAQARATLDFPLRKFFLELNAAQDDGAKLYQAPQHKELA